MTKIYYSSSMHTGFEVRDIPEEAETSGANSWQSYREHQQECSLCSHQSLPLPQSSLHCRRMAQKVAKHISWLQQHCFQQRIQFSKRLRDQWKYCQLLQRRLQVGQQWPQPEAAVAGHPMVNREYAPTHITDLYLLLLSTDLLQCQCMARLRPGNNTTPRQWLAVAIKPLTLDLRTEFL